MSKMEVTKWMCDWCGKIVETLPTVKTHETLPPKTIPAKMESSWLVINGFEGNSLLFGAAEQICGKCAVAVHEAKLTRTQRGAA